ncbi:MAG: YbbR-like domain-containing protein [Oscillospiraceae bacterium]
MKNMILNFLHDLKQNYKTLILGFIIAFGFWIIVSIQVFPTIEDNISGIAIEAPITDFMAQNNLQVISDITETVSIKIEGKRYDISDLSASDFFATADLTSIHAAGSYTLPLNIASKTDREYTLVTVEPRMITLTVDEIITKELTVIPTAPDISLPENYYVDELIASPAKITVTGSASVVNSISKVEARSTYHGELRESSRTNSDLYMFNSAGTRIPTDGLTLSPESIAVEIPIYRQKELPLKISITNYPSNFDIESLKYEIQPKTLTIAAPDDTIDALSALDIGAIDISDIQLNKNTLIPIVLPEGYKNLSGNNNALIEWKFDNYGSLDFRVNRNNITITNAPENFDVSLVTNQLTFTVIGPSNKLSEFTTSDFTVNVNLLGTTLREGTQDVTVSVSIKGARQNCWVSGTYKVTINAVSNVTE